MERPALIIDLDDTLYDAEAAYAHALRTIGIDPNSSEFVEARRETKSRLGEGHVGARNRILYFKRVLDGRGQYSHDAVLEMMEQYEKSLSEYIRSQWSFLERGKLFEGKLASVPKVILTNENLRTQLIKLRAIDPQGTLFPHVITSEEMGVEKPHLSLFQRALETLKCGPKDCVMVGDSLETDVMPALQLGIRSFLTTEFRKPKPHQIVPQEVTTLSRLDELEGIFL